MKLVSLLHLALGLGLAANGIAMLAAPEAWYRALPGVVQTGPLNLHFVRDIGCAYLVAGASFLWLRRTALARPAALAGTGFLLLHAAVHLGEALTGAAGARHLLRDLPGVFLVPLVALWLAWPRRVSNPTKENCDVTMDRAAQARRI